eukprot:gene4498-85_t
MKRFKAIARFAQRVWYETFTKDKPLPNPDWFVEQQKLNANLSWKERLRKAWQLYLDTWRSSAAKQARDEEAFRHLVEEQKAAMQTIQQDSKSLMATASPAVRDYMMEWVGIYRSVLQRFSEGYKDGVSSSDWDSVTAWSDTHKNPNTAAGSCNQTSTSITGQPSPANQNKIHKSAPYPQEYKANGNDSHKDGHSQTQDAITNKSPKMGK